MRNELNPRNLLAFAHDIVAAGAAWCTAYLLRFNFDIPPAFSSGMFNLLALIVPLHAVIFWRFGLYRGLWRYASLQDMKRIFTAVGVAAAALAVLAYMVSSQSQVPRAVLVLHPLLLVAMMGGSRVAYRLFKEYRLYGHARILGDPVLVVGAGEAAVNLLRELTRSSVWHVVGLLDDDPGTHGREIAGVTVLGPVSELARYASHLQVKNVILALPAATASRRRHAIEMAGAADLAVHTVPAFADLLSGKVSISQIRKVELEDLLGREEVQLDDVRLHHFLTAKTVLVTGAGGSIGSELCRQILQYRPARLVLFELSEYALYAMQQEFEVLPAGIEVVPLVGDVKDQRRVREVLNAYQPDIVFHAAAYKHVPLMEEGNAWQAVINNACGTLIVGEAARAAGVSKFVLISTDKAVRPTSIMGASKRLAERLCQGFDGGGMRCVTVRFGNVLGSTGSVIPKFKEQIARGGPVTVTDPEMNRFFMTIPEAAQLVLQAGQMGEGGEIFVLDMGEPVLIVDLARDMIRLSGFAEDEIKIVFTGLRPGEKLYEELLADNEETLPTPHPKLRVARHEAQPDEAWQAEVRAWLSAGSGDVRLGLKHFVPDYLGAQ